MTRLTFQFHPLVHVRNSGESLDLPLDEVEKIEDIGGGLTIMHLADGAQLEIDRDGEIRYSSSINSITEEAMEKIYSSALFIIKNMPTFDENGYSVILVLNDEDAVDQYLDHSEEIHGFAKRTLDSPNPRYTELGEETIKLSFGVKPRPGVV